MMRVADYVIGRLAKEGARHLFMVTGRGVLHLSDAAAKCSEMECVCVHNEQAGAYAAMAYAQCNGAIGACLVSTGCASTNAMTGVLCAWQDDVPCVFVSGQNTLRETTRYTGLRIRSFGQQELDIVSLVRPITKYAVMLEDPLTVAYEMDRALYAMREGRSGPVWIDVPLDVQNMRVDPHDMPRFSPEPILVDSLEVAAREIAEMFLASKRPVVLLGSGVRSDGADEDIARFVEKYRLPVTYDSGAVDVFTHEHDLSMGVVSAIAGNRAANFTVQNADLVLVLGSRLTSMVVGDSPEKFARAAKIVVVGNDANEFGKNTVHYDKTLCANCLDVVRAIDRIGIPRTSNAWQETCLRWRRIFPKCESMRKDVEPMDMYWFADILSDYLPNESVLVVDSGFEQLIMSSAVRYKRGQRCVQPISQGAMGYAIPASCGAYLALGKSTVCVTGDGAAMMNLQELQTIMHHGYPVRLFVINNNGYAVIRKRQQDLFRTRTVGTDASDGVSFPSYERIATAFGLKYTFIKSAEDARQILPRVFSMDGPVLCEVYTTSEQTVIHSSFARTKTGKVVKRPLEDQSPYLNREIFLREMLVEPIDQ